MVTGDRVASKDYLKRLAEVTPLLKEVQQFLKTPELEALRPEAGEALTASVVEFILEGLHVENRLNKAAKGGEIVFKR